MTGVIEVVVSAAIKYSFGMIVTAAGKKIAEGKSIIAAPFKNDEIIDKYTESCINKVFTLRTLIQSNKDIYLNEIYYPLEIRQIDKGNDITIDENTILPQHAPIVIVGLAGQGKTMIMRKLFLEELTFKERIPFFVSLRHINNFENLSCEEMLLDHFNFNGVQCNLADVKFILNDLPTTFFFDGFDEIAVNQRAHALKTIYDVRAKYNSKVIVTTRPETEITRQPGYDLYNVSFLSENKITEIIDFLVQNKEVVTILNTMLNEKAFLKQSIITPILLDIFIITSTNLSDDPTSVTDYYNNLFSSLIYRHDLLKNLSRERCSNLNNKELERCFSSFSFLSFFMNINDFNHEHLLELFNKSLKIMKKDDNPEHVAYDIINGTNIIVKDGYDNYVYLHRSIQEFFAAKCLCAIDVQTKKKFYNSISQKHLDSSLMNFLTMSSHLDSFYFCEIFLLPELKTLNFLSEENIITPLSKDEIIASLEKHRILFDKENGSIMSFNHVETGKSQALHRFDFLHGIIKNGFMTGYYDHTLKYFYTNGHELKEPYLSGAFDVYFSGKGIDDRDFDIINTIQILEYMNVFDDIMTSIYSTHLQMIKNIESHLKINYFDQKESKTLMSDIVEQMKFSS
ncbi:MULTISPECIES: NACHT domain-containing protein [Klebsiella]|uniref:NACHT domain-containing protein n=1 Tax=Klebsiella TaxID=570 RepID=UPI0012B72720|nr:MULTISPECIES: NACHT domain-containing protein [Klebsiella]MCW9527756.1 NACHT domain-containing protein [Klebsiella grimontii]WKM70923.1 NACHT domain-containing protein [Klebsiella oxytoca]